MTLTAALIVALNGSAWDRVFALEGLMGLGTPSGYGAVVGDLTIEPWFAVATGVGATFSGVQWSVTPRLQLPFEQFALAWGVGVSGGPNQSVAIGESPRAAWDHAWWLNSELSIVRRRDDIQQRWAFGYGYILNDESCRWTELGPRATCDRFPGTTLAPYVQYSVGYVF